MESKRVREDDQGAWQLSKCNQGRGHMKIWREGEGLNLLFDHARDMAKIFIVGLDHCLVKLPRLQGQHFQIEVEDLTYQEWADLWRSPIAGKPLFSVDVFEKLANVSSRGGDSNNGGGHSAPGSNNGGGGSAPNNGGGGSAGSGASADHGDGGVLGGAGGGSPGDGQRGRGDNGGGGHHGGGRRGRGRGIRVRGQRASIRLQQLHARGKEEEDSSNIGENAALPIDIPSTSIDGTSVQAPSTSAQAPSTSTHVQAPSTSAQATSTSTQATSTSTQSELKKVVVVIKIKGQPGEGIQPPVSQPGEGIQPPLLKLASQNKNSCQMNALLELSFSQQSMVAQRMLDVSMTSTFGLHTPIVEKIDNETRAGILHDMLFTSYYCKEEPALELENCSFLTTSKVTLSKRKASNKSTGWTFGAEFQASGKAGPATLLGKGSLARAQLSSATNEQTKSSDVQVIEGTNFIVSNSCFSREHNSEMLSYVAEHITNLENATLEETGIAERMSVHDKKKLKDAGFKAQASTEEVSDLAKVMRLTMEGRFWVMGDAWQQHIFEMTRTLAEYVFEAPKRGRLRKWISRKKRIVPKLVSAKQVVQRSFQVNHGFLWGEFGAPRDQFWIILNSLANNPIPGLIIP